MSKLMSSQAKKFLDLVREAVDTTETLVVSPGVGGPTTFDGWRSEVLELLNVLRGVCHDYETSCPEIAERIPS